MAKHDPIFWILLLFGTLLVASFGTAGKQCLWGMHVYGKTVPELQFFGFTNATQSKNTSTKRWVTETCATLLTHLTTLRLPLPRWFIPHTLLIYFKHWGKLSTIWTVRIVFVSFQYPVSPFVVAGGVPSQLHSTPDPPPSIVQLLPLTFHLWKIQNLQRQYKAGCTVLPDYARAFA